MLYCKLISHIFVSEKLAWVELNDTIPKYNKIYDFKSTWPVESFKKLVLQKNKLNFGLN